MFEINEEGIEISLVNSRERRVVLSHLAEEFRNNVKAIYSVKNTECEKRFNDYISENKIKTTRLLWHGSRDNRWDSIIRNGLSIVYANNGLFGRGIYTATSAYKSSGYKAHYMGLFKTAYGKPYEAYSKHSFTKEFIEKQGKNCVHAKSGCETYSNDEVIFFNDNALLLKYIVEFE